MTKREYEDEIIRLREIIQDLEEENAELKAENERLRDRE